MSYKVSFKGLDESQSKKLGRVNSIYKRLMPGGDKTFKEESLKKTVTIHKKSIGLGQNEKGDLYFKKSLVEIVADLSEKLRKVE